MQDRERLLKLLHKIMNPDIYGTSETEGDDDLLQFCASCPDPIGAAWLVIECLDPMTNEELVDRALAMAPRSLGEVPDS